MVARRAYILVVMAREFAGWSLIMRSGISCDDLSTVEVCARTDTMVEGGNTRSFADSRDVAAGPTGMV